MADTTSSSSVSIDSINSLIGATNTNRVSGLASGIDVDSIVAKLMVAESQPLVQLQQKLQLEEWQRDDYRSMNTLLNALQTNVSTMKLQGTYLAKTVQSSDSSKVTATAGVTAGNASYTLSNIKMATASSVIGGKITTNSSFDPDATLDSMKSYLSPGSIDESTVSFTINTYDQNGNAIGPQTFNFDPTKTSLNDVLSQISQSNLGINAFYDQSTHQVVMTRTDTGKLAPDGHSEIEFSDVSGSFTSNTLNMSTAMITQGQDASFTVNAQADGTGGLATTRHSNTFTLGGVTFTLQGNTTATDQNVTLRVNTDTDTVYNSISDFVDKYNDTISQINDKISETRNRDYTPLTDAQKASMSDSDIAAWNAKAQSGMLQNDNILSSVLSQMRTNLYSPVSGTSSSTLNQLAAIGITTSSNYLDHGKLIISDPEKLKQAISTNPQAVMEMFTNKGTDSDPSSQGIMQRLNTTINSAFTQIEDRAGNTNWTSAQYSLGKSIDDLNDQISSFKEKLVNIQNRYYTQFDAMEAAIEQANSQASYLSQFISS